MAVIPKIVENTGREYIIVPGDDAPDPSFAYPAEVSVMLGKYSAPPHNRFIELNLPDETSYLKMLPMTSRATINRHLHRIDADGPFPDNRYKIELMLKHSWMADYWRLLCMTDLLKCMLAQELCGASDVDKILEMEKPKRFMERG